MSAAPTTAEVHPPERYGLLLCAIAFVFAVQGIAEPTAWEQIIVSVVLGLSLLLALRAAQVRPIVMHVAYVVVFLVTVWSAAHALAGTVDPVSTRMANALLVVLAPPAIVVGVARSLRRRQGVSLQAVFGVLCVYLLFGMFFAFVYGSINNLGNGQFFAGGEAATTARCIYFSFTTLTTVGYGDLTARTNLGHTLAVSEALIGQIYLVTIVSMIVANLGASRTGRTGGSTES